MSVTAALSSAVAQNTQPPVTFTSDQDHQNMMDQLGIKALRPGPSGNEKAPNHANYDESLANPYNNVPDPLVVERWPQSHHSRRCGGKSAVVRNRRQPV